MTDEHDHEPTSADDLLSWGQHDGEDTSSGLEIDDQQAEEIKSIFLTTLPQYLEPVEQMVGQLFGDDGSVSGETQQALSATVSSLAAAAARIGFDEIRSLFVQMDDVVAGVEADGASAADIERELLAGLRRIRLIATGDAGDGGAPASTSVTLVAALRGFDGVDESVLGRLTAAGLVSVDQLLMADADEIVAVTGLDADVVDDILDAVTRHDMAAKRAGAADAGARDEAGGPVELGLGEGALRANLDHKRRAQAEVESSIDELRAELRRLRARTSELRRELDGIEGAGEVGAGAGDADLSERMEELAALRATREELARKCAATETAVREEEQRIIILRRDRQAILDEVTRFDEKVAGIVKQVERLLRTASGT